MLVALLLMLALPCLYSMYKLYREATMGFGLLGVGKIRE